MMWICLILNTELPKPRIHLKSLNGTDLTIKPTSLTNLASHRTASPTRPTNRYARRRTHESRIASHAIGLLPHRHVPAASFLTKFNFVIRKHPKFPCHSCHSWHSVIMQSPRLDPCHFALAIIRIHPQRFAASKASALTTSAGSRHYVELTILTFFSIYIARPNGLPRQRLRPSPRQRETLLNFE